MHEHFTIIYIKKKNKYKPNPIDEYSFLMAKHSTLVDFKCLSQVWETSLDGYSNVHFSFNQTFNILLQLITVHAMKQVTTISQYLLMDVKALLNVPPSFQRRHKTVQKVYCSMLLSAGVTMLIWWAARLIVSGNYNTTTNNNNTKEYVLFMVLFRLCKVWWQCLVL